MRLLIIEDNALMTRTLQHRLEKLYRIDCANSGEQGEYLAHINNYDLIILDLGLPDIDGTLVAKRIREQGIQTPILALTARADTTDKVKALDLGFDDYLVKPFRFEELEARIRALLRRESQIPSPTVLTVGELTLDLVNREVRRGDQKIHLRRKEFDLLEYLMRNPGKVLSRPMILDHVWDTSYEGLTNTIDVHIKYLRDRIDRGQSKKLIQTVHGMGYKIEP